MVPDFTLTYYSKDIFSPFESRHAFFFLNLRTRILISLSECKQGLAEVTTLVWYKPLSFSYANYVTWDQAQFSFRSVNNILLGKAKQKESLIQTFYETSAPTFLIDWHLLNQQAKITSVACFFSLQIFHTWESCRLADIKSSFYLLRIKQSEQSHLTSCEITRRRCRSLFLLGA